MLITTAREDILIIIAPKGIVIIGAIIAAAVVEVTIGLIFALIKGVILAITVLALTMTLIFLFTILTIITTTITMTVADLFCALVWDWVQAVAVTDRFILMNSTSTH